MRIIRYGLLLKKIEIINITNNELTIQFENGDMKNFYNPSE